MKAHAVTFYFARTCYCFDDKLGVATLTASSLLYTLVIL